MESKLPCVYFVTNRPNGTLYLGVTSTLVKRVWQHKQGLVKGFSRKYQTKSLVWYEQHGDMYQAITREKQIKKWRRQWKIDLIEAMNPEWKDLYLELCG